MNCYSLQSKDKSNVYGYFTSWLLFVMSNCDFVTFPCTELWYLIVLIPDLCHLSYISKQSDWQGRIQDFWKGCSVGFRFDDFISSFLKYPMKMK